jgi:hypothetical protein
MAYGLIGLYALYFILVGINGNAKNMVAEVQNDGKGFIPWILAILVLRAMYASETLRPLIKPFIGLAALVFFLRNYGTIAGQLNEILPSNVQLPISGNKP